MVRWISFFYQNKTSVARRQKRTNPFVQSAAADVAIRGYNGKGKLSLLLSDLVVKRMAMMRDVKQRCRHMRNIGLRQWRSASGPGSIHCSSSSVSLSLSLSFIRSKGPVANGHLVIAHFSTGDSASGLSAGRPITVVPLKGSQTSV
jgi:hypothetical protein